MVKRIKKKGPTPKEREGARFLAKLDRDGVVWFKDGSKCVVGVGPRGPRVEATPGMAQDFLRRMNPTAVYEEPLVSPAPAPEPAPEPAHQPAVVSRLGEFPVYHYSRMKLTDGMIEDTSARETVETQELVNSMRQAQCYVPDASDVVALHRSGSFLCWELNANLFIIDDEGCQSACHIFSCRQLALNVLRGYTGRRAAKKREGHIRSYNHSRGWLFKVEEILLNHL